ncbi:MAG: hypothetical protein AVDCRST_MAG54-4238, partial [uncultured Actinomycetospora sp.]
GPPRLRRPPPSRGPGRGPVLRPRLPASGPPVGEPRGPVRLRGVLVAGRRRARAVGEVAPAGL